MFEFWLTVILLLLTGVLACASMIAARQPNAGTAISKLVPFQGIIGLVALVWGIYNLILAITSGFAGVGSVAGLLALAAIILNILLGFLLGWGLIASATKGGGGAANVQRKLAGMQGLLGILSIAVGLILLIIYIFKIQI